MESSAERDPDRSGVGSAVVTSSEDRGVDIDESNGGDRKWKREGSVED